MGISSLRSLLLAAIFLSNYVTWTASRHHYTHNVNGHRSRHRRQGAGLFLPASYIIPDGDGSGAWGEWGTVSACSRTCGGGVASQKRICLEFGSDGQPLCTGGDTKYFSCQTQDCPDGAGDFRSEQCASYDNKTFRDQKYNWVPYTKAQNPCELNCMPRGERFYYRQQPKVADGTRCNDESFDVCVDGVCQPVGCDMMLGSNSREDKCRRCRGNGTDCYTTKGILDSQDYRKGYNDILLIPEGATNIFIEEVRDSNNYLALRAKQDNVYYLNGDYHIDFPRRLRIAGALWFYERSQQGLAAPDKLRCLGPISEPLYLSLLLQDDNVGVQYEYSVPSALAPPPSQQYVWVHDEFSPCSATCGGGIQTRTATCRSREELQEVEEALCDSALRPPTNQSCNTDACAPQWVRGEWGPCSKPCGADGIRSRQVYCQKIISNGYPSVVADEECSGLLGLKPKSYEQCNTNATCPTWFTEPWKPCDKLCGEGKQKRLVVCHQRVNGRVEIYDDDTCTDEKPESERSCNLHPCGGVDWMLSDWSGCDTCLSTNRTRTAHCATKDHKVVASELCAYHRPPVLVEPCDSAALPPCQYLWYATQWNKCSAECGNGTQTRRVFCGRFDGVTVAAVEDERCNPDDRYKDTKPCSVPKELCPARWFTGPWPACPKECGGGERKRRVMCISGGREVLDCDELTVPDSIQSCNTQPCNGDEVLPVDSKSPPIVDEQECDPEAEDYPEENIEIDPVVEDEFDESDFSLIPDFKTTRATEGSGWETTTDIFDYTDGSGNSYSDETLSTDIDSSTTELSGSTETVSEITGSDVTVITESESTDTSSTEISSSNSTEVTDSENTSIEPTMVTEKKYSDTEVPETTGTGTGTESSGSTDATDITSTDLSTETTSSVVLDDLPDLPDTTDEETELIISTEGRSTDTSLVTESSTYIDYETDSESTTNTDLSISTDYAERTNSESTESETKKSDLTETGSTESTVTELTDTTSESSSSVNEGSTTEESTGSTEVVITEESSTTNVPSSGSTETSESSSTSSTESEMSTVTIETSESESTSFTTEFSKSEVSTSESDVTESSTTESGTTESGPTELGTTGLGTNESDTTESSTTESGTTESGTTESGTTESSTAESGTTEASSIESSSSGYSSTESSPTESGSAETDLIESSTSVTSESNTSESETTISDTSEASTTESSTLQSSELSTTSEISISTEASPTEMSASSIIFIEPTESTTGSGETTASVITESTYATESSTLESGSTVEISTPESAENTTPWVRPLIERHEKPPCKVRKTKCAKSKFGCCPDKRTPAAGPFDEGCPIPETCAESTYGCCPDGVSAAAGPAARDCPVMPCAVTLYGCCRSDNVTAAEGNEQEGCPEPPPPCFFTKYGCCQDNVTEAKGLGFEGCLQTVTETESPSTTVVAGCEVSEFGCCYDGETEASGPDSQGCPCSITEFGCCPDGVSISRGPNLEGCVMTCHTSAYGCCPDGETPAHGPDGEGCCLQAPYGCCPDNYKAAEGPHLEGCGCQYAHFGCCPDNITIARGPNREGCGCQDSPNGCCPDRHTAAEGPGYRGCACNTYQFGCCSDGVTVATGPNQQGCICQHSEFGCCGDDITHATGPNMQGCNCASSKYGCCPDGVSEAKGKNFLNCTDLLDNRQAACGLSNDRGSCHNYTVYWFYDVTYGGCSRFWYSGCEGNGNRFVSQAECQDVCVHPPPKDVCRLPKVKGACTGYNVRWYYDASREQCSQFVYGGCLGNDNNFETQELCQKRCEPEKTEDQCNLPVEAGPCAGHFPRWAHSGGRCEQFTWGGCGGNANRFGSEAACRLRCAPPGQPIQACSLPQEAGNCTEKHPAWAFSYTENRCVPFYYTGCGGNANRFESEQICSEACPAAHEQEKCTLPAVIGDCAEYSSRWFFDTSVQRCRQFYYGGCGGNENNFVSERECENACMESEEPITLPPTVPSTQPPTQPPTQAPTQPPTPIQTTTPGTLPEFCLLDIDQGPCTEMETRWAYDLSRNKCVTFEYGSCGGNRNNFPSEEYCSYYCPSRLAPEPEPEPEPVPDIESPSGTVLRIAEDICNLPMISGPCDQSVMQWFYDAARGVCSQFTYSGCEGNDNRFDSQEQCERKCKSSPQVNVTSTTTIVPEPNECQISNELEECTEQDVVWFFNPQKGQCRLYENKNSGRECRRTGTFSSEEECERSCGAFRGLDVCRYEMDPGPCRAAVPKVYYNLVSRRCERFTYGGCLGSPNRFSTVEECEQICPTENLSVDPCVLPPETGNCLASISTWYYDAARGECDVFFYGGCNGNDNRFTSREMCESRCKKASTTTVAFVLSTITTTTTNAPLITTHETVLEDECSTPTSLAPCGDNVTAFYYDSASRACLRALTGACGHPNNYRSEEECERRCGAFRNLDVCGSPLDAGPCQAAIPKYYWDALSGRCLSFAYGGCDGGPNRFSTVDECEDLCGHTAPVESNEVVPDCSAYAAECAALRCEYGVQRTRTAAGCERCACVPVDVDCAPLRRECERLTCHYGVRRATGADGCERCTCLDHPCAGARCGAGQRCVAAPYRDALTADVRYSTDCRTVNKTGVCPDVEESEIAEGQCRRECNDDADCIGVGKCCERGCSSLCLQPAPPATPAPAPSPAATSDPNAVRAPELPQAPSAVAALTEPEVRASEGGKATLRCLFHGNPPPTITWRWGAITIESDTGRYRLLTDGSLEIVSLYRNDSGVYICVATNELGHATQEIRLEVDGPVNTKAGIAGEPNAVVMGELGRPLSVRCLSYGFPPPAIYWYHGRDGPMVPYSSPLYEARDNVLQIRKLSPDTLGEYICQAYNGIESPAEWSVTIEALRTDIEEDHPFLLPRYGEGPMTTAEPTTEASTTPEPRLMERPVFTVPVSTRIVSSRTRVAAGSEINLPCEVDGYPLPAVHWTRDGVPLRGDDRVSVTEARLTILRAQSNDSGVYGCHAANAYSSHYSTIEINVQGLYIPPNCKDNPYFATCHLIVKSKFCHHKYYSGFCCKSCVEAGQLDPNDLIMQADMWTWKK